MSHRLTTPFFAGSVLAALILSGTFSSPTLAGPLEDGAQAYSSGDFKTAYSHWSKAAAAGDAKGQYNIAILSDQ